MNGEGQAGGGPGRQQPFLVRVSRYAVIGIEFPGTVIGGLFLGYLADLYFDSFPWLMACFTLLALVGGCIRLAHWLRRFADKDE